MAPTKSKYYPVGYNLMLGNLAQQEKETICIGLQTPYQPEELVLNEAVTAYKISQGNCCSINYAYSPLPRPLLS